MEKKQNMSIYLLERTQVLPVSLEKAWEFFSSPFNLKEITPTDMKFEVTSESAREKMYPGMIITYKVRPVLSIPVTWVTEITQVREPFYFVDEQRFGPYEMWHHQHFFKETDKGVEMRDVVHYKVPLGFLGDVANSVFVRARLEEIFDFRYKKLEELFGR
jgi:ligand-binding SRPBCC domain-containing protein